MQDIIEAIKRIKSAAILPHISADGDAVASCRAMSEILRILGKESVIYAEEDVEPRLEFISDGIKVFDGNIGEHDTCIVLDCGDCERTGKRHVIMDAAKQVINIDHHKTNTGFGDVSLVVSDASATGEILAELISVMGIDVTDELAKYLYTAICSDTGCFAYSNVSPKTFRIASELIEHNINHAEIARLLFDCVDLDSELLKGELTKNIHSYYDGKLRVVCVTEEFAKTFHVQTNQLQGLVDIPRRIRGTEVAAAIKIVNGIYRVSLRSTGDTDVAKIAMSFGGGGHTKAAGCSIDANDIDEAECMLVKECEGVFA